MKSMSISGGKMDNSRSWHLPQTELVACPHATQYSCRKTMFSRRKTLFSRRKTLFSLCSSAGKLCSAFVHPPENYVQPPKNFVQPPENYVQPLFSRRKTLFSLLTGNFWSDFLPNDKLGWAEILQEGRNHSNASPCQKLDKPTSRISRKMWIGCRWLWSFSRKPCTGLSWKFPWLFFMILCILCPNFMRIQLTNWKIFPNQILYFWTWKQCILAELPEPIFQKLRTGLGWNFSSR